MKLLTTLLLLIAGLLFGSNTNLKTQKVRNISAQGKLNRSKIGATA